MEREKPPTRRELIAQLIEMKMRNPCHVNLFIGKREVVIERELEQRLNPDDSLPRVY